MIKDIAFVAYPSANVRQTREWYERMLGLKFSGPYEEGGVEQYNEANVGAGCFGLMTEAWIERKAGSGCGLAFEVEDLEAMIADLRAKGLTVEDAYETPVCRLTSFEDPEGNKVTLHEATAAR